ncbi:MAG TPA: lytic transglycosylase domain-containing protein [Vicinamibacterales bacterium]
MLSITAVAPARAELVFFQSGRAMSVRAIRSDGDQLVLQLRSGGDIHCDKSLIVKVQPDEVEYPEDVLQALPFARTIVIFEPPAIPEQYRDLVTQTAARHGVDARVVNALIQVESAYHSRAESPKGARGLMQLMPATGRQYGALDLFDPKVNLEAGIQHLKRLLARYDLPIALAAYNAGEAAVDRFRGIPPFRETQDYVTRILRLLNRS